MEVTNSEKMSRKRFMAARCALWTPSGVFEVGGLSQGWSGVGPSLDHLERRFGWTI